ncbi:MAG: hypothetical protein IID37_00775 [Planctomycetes bacterium]|nr:hypothetical protein [Planctomycetota bacterium]
MEQSTATHDRRARSVALFGLLTQVVVVAAAIGIAVWSGATAAAFVSVHLIGGLPIWLVLLLIYTQRNRCRTEALEIEQLRTEKNATGEALFDLDDESLHLERRRLRWLERYALWAVSVALIIYHAAAVWYLYPWLASPLTQPDWKRADDPAITIWFVGGICFACFLLSRYAGGMAREPQWRLLRAASAYLTGNALACLAVVIALVASIFDLAYGEPLAAYLITIMIALLGVEFLVNLVLDVYRPRVAGQEVRPGFDSRLLGLVAEPGGFARSIAEAVNYQFGFEVSSTWFFKLAQRSLLPLLVFMGFVLWALSAVVVVDADEQAVIERFGRRATGSRQVLDPGLYIKWPWPIETLYRAPTQRIESLVLGHAADDDEDDDGDHKAILWTEKHDFVEATMLLVAGPRDLPVSSSALRGLGIDDDESKSVSVALMHGSVTVQYRISNLSDYLSRYRDPEQVIENIAHRVLADYAASTELTELMGPGRGRFNEQISTALQAQVDDLKLGLEIVFVALQDAHPPQTSDVAKTFQGVVSAERRKEATIEEARGAAQRIKTEAAGSIRVADALNSAIREMDRLSADPNADPAALAEAKSTVEAFFAGLLTTSADGVLEPGFRDGSGALAGKAAQLIADAQANVIREISAMASKVRRLDDDLVAYRASPELYKMRKYLAVLTSGVADIRKWIVAADVDLVVTLEEERETDFDFSDLEPEVGGAAIR